MAKAKPAAETDLPALRRQINELIARNAVAMVQRAIDLVTEEGQYQAIKYLFEMIGLYPAASGSEDEHEESLARKLLQHLGIPENTQKSSPEYNQQTPCEPIE
jgi:hypothetical protein